MRPQQRADKDGIVLVAVGVRALVPLQHVQLALRNFSAGYGGCTVLGEVFAGTDVVVDAPDLLECAGGREAVGPEEVEHEVATSVGRGFGAAEAERGEEGGHFGVKSIEYF